MIVPLLVGCCRDSDVTRAVHVAKQRLGCKDIGPQGILTLCRTPALPPSALAHQYIKVSIGPGCLMAPPMSELW